MLSHAMPVPPGVCGGGGGGRATKQAKEHRARSGPVLCGLREQVDDNALHSIRRELAQIEQFYHFVHQSGAA